MCRVKKSLSEGALRPSDLLAQFKQTEASSRAGIRAAELLDNTVEVLREMVYTQTMVQPSPHGNEPFKRQICPFTHIQHNSVIKGAAAIK